MTVAEQIYNTIIEHCGTPKDVTLKGVTWQSLMNMKEGKANPSIGTISKIFKANGIPAELVLTVKVEGKTGKTKIKL